MWIARSKEGDLSLHNNKPIWKRIKGDYHDYTVWDDDNEHPLYMDENLYPEVTFENSPKKVRLIFSKET